MTAPPPTAVTGKPPIDQVLLHCIPGGSSLVCKKQKDLMNTNSNSACLMGLTEPCSSYHFPNLLCNPTTEGTAVNVHLFV